MYELIQEKLKEIEQTEGIRILHAVESGSRAWGFPSPDSDYDVRFFYIRKPEFYLRLDKTRDVVELPINDLLDINGWDLSKTLQLMHSSNPTLFEWMNSPIVYRRTEFADELQPYLDRYFSCKSGLYHYLNMAKNNNREFLKEDMVKLKKYFYVMRPILACRWILHRQTRPPMLFRELMDAELERSLKGEVERLLDLKMNAPEVKLIPRVEKLNAWIEASLESVRAQAETLPDREYPDWEPLNALFLKVLGTWDLE